ncbi:hypothetical protein GGI25_000598 [Coemansia spiralis]|uniref:RGS domain-containing protein n=1 Tax=Coemansia spiralis TaxID=417178 RepID=A0A9W8GBQ6_9FUNG|nr:hypothetical protein GGI26_000639 [Coemansia sp. RSA 1358]KAJ2680625.1 hypothetical protein GGI25_000598 [Coemansia spiralis]
MRFALLSLALLVSTALSAPAVWRRDMDAAVAAFNTISGSANDQALVSNVNTFFTNLNGVADPKQVQLAEKQVSDQIVANNRNKVPTAQTASLVASILAHFVNPQVEVLLDWAPGSTKYRIRSITMTCLSAIYALFVLVTTIMFLIVARNKRSGLDKRSAKLVIFQALGCYLVGVDGLTTAALNNWACFGKLWLFNVGFIMSLTAMSARAFHLLVVYKVHELASKLSSRDPGAINSVLTKNLKQTDTSRSSLDDPSAVNEKGMHGLTSRPISRKLSRISANLRRTNPHERLRLSQQLHKYRQLLRYTTDRMLLLYVSLSLLFIVILSFIINATDKQFSMKPVNIVCDAIWGFIPGLAIIIFYFFIVFPIILWRVWRHNDAYGIRNDLIICDTVGVTVMVVTLVWVLVLQETQQIWPGLSYIWVYAILIHISSVFVPLLKAIRHTKQAIDGATPQLIYSAAQASTTMPTTIGMSRRRSEFNRMLDSVHEYEKFRTFAASCFCSELTSFAEEYQVLKSQVVALFERRSSEEDKNNSPVTPNTLSMNTERTSREAAIQSIRLSQCLVDNALLQSTEFALPLPQTCVTVSILATLLEKQPELSQDSLTYPQPLAHKLLSIYREYVDPNSLTSVNASSMVVRRITENINTNYFPITLFDELKDEVLFMLYSDVYTRYTKK